jgi:hypothetical protein
MRKIIFDYSLVARNTVAQTSGIKLILVNLIIESCRLFTNAVCDRSILSFSKAGRVDASTMHSSVHRCLRKSLVIHLKRSVEDKRYHHHVIENIGSYPHVGLLNSPRLLLLSCHYHNFPPLYTSLPPHWLSLSLSLSLTLLLSYFRHFLSPRGRISRHFVKTRRHRMPIVRPSFNFFFFFLFPFFFFRL